MTEKLMIPADAAGRIDVFALDLPGDEAEAFIARDEDTDDPKEAWPLRAALGADFLDPAGVELVAIKDLDGLGLSAYLAEGLGAEERELAQHKGRLDALTGHVAVLRGRAYGGLAQTLTPRPPLGHVVTLHETEAAPPGPPLHSDSAEPSALTPEDDEDEPMPTGSGSPVPVIAGGLIAAAALVLVLGLVLGG